MEGGIVSTKFRLSLMMFLQYAIWGAWYPALSEYVTNTLGFSGVQLGVLYMLLPFANVLAPFIGGQIADRYFPTQWVISFVQFVGGVLLIFMSRVTDYNTLMISMLIYSILYSPTLALTNSIAMVNLENIEKDFGRIRVWGTLGWIAAGLLLSGWRLVAQGNTSFAYAGDTLLLAGIFSLIMGVQSLTLPHTPPNKQAASPWAFLEALKMLKDRNFAVLIIISFIVSTELMFYYVLTAPFLVTESIGVSRSGLTTVMALAQFAEIFVMALALPVVLPRYGIRKTMMVGILAWPVRYIIFAIGSPAWLVIASLTLHGFCYVFFFTVAQVYVDKAAPRDIRASAQSFIALVTLGVGNLIGSYFAGWVKDLFTDGDMINWTGVFMVPTVLTIMAAILFLALFKDDKAAQA